MDGHRLVLPANKSKHLFNVISYQTIMLKKTLNTSVLIFDSNYTVFHYQYWLQLYHEQTIVQQIPCKQQLLIKQKKPQKTQVLEYCFDIEIYIAYVITTESCHVKWKIYNNTIEDISFNRKDYSSAILEILDFESRP